MPESPADPKIYTVEEANAMLPVVQRALVLLRQQVTQILGQEARVDALELLDGKPVATQSTMVAQELTILEQRKTALQRTFEDFERLGCLLKDLDMGLVDFYTWMDGELVLLCWHEGEEHIRYWHTMEDGFPGRRHIPGA